MADTPASTASLPNKPLRDYTVTEVASAIGTRQAKEAATNQKFIDGDHWQEGHGWIGPYPISTDPGAAQAIAEIKKGFTSRNIILEVSERHSSGVVGRESAWDYIPLRELEEDEEPSPDEATAIDELEAAVTPWWNERGIPALINEAVKTCLHQGRAILRFFVPLGLMNKTETRQGRRVNTEYEAKATDLLEALSKIYIDSPHPKDAAILLDPDTMQPVSMYKFSMANREYADLGYVDDDGRTVIKRIGGDKTRAEEFPLPLGGRLLMFQLERSLLITQQVQQQQRAHNLAMSMLPRNVVTGGFMERIITNAMLPGRYVDDDTHPTGKRFVPDPYYTGPGTTNFLAGTVLEDRDGRKSIANPTVQFRDPVDPAPTIAAIDAHYSNILHEVDQAHHLTSGKTEVSAVSRVEARLDFLLSLRRTQGPTEAMGRWILETVVALAEAMVGGSMEEATKPYTGLLRADFRCRLQAGQLTAEEQTVLMDRVDRGLTPREDAMHLLNIDDVDAALSKINAQPGSMLEMRQKQAEVFGAWIAAGVTVEVAARLAGFDEDSEEYKLLTQMDPAGEGQVTEQ